MVPVQYCWLFIILRSGSVSSYLCRYELSGQGGWKFGEMAEFGLMHWSWKPATMWVVRGFKSYSHRFWVVVNYCLLLTITEDRKLIQQGTIYRCLGCTECARSMRQIRQRIAVSTETKDLNSLQLVENQQASFADMVELADTHASGACILMICEFKSHCPHYRWIQWVKQPRKTFGSPKIPKWLRLFSNSQWKQIP